MLCGCVRVQSVSTMMNENHVQTDTCPAEMYILGYEILLEFIQTKVIITNTVSKSQMLCLKAIK